MSYAKNFYIERAIKGSNLSLESTDTYLLVFIAYIAKSQSVSLDIPLLEIIKECSYENFTSNELESRITNTDNLSMKNFESVSEKEILSYLTNPTSSKFQYSINQPNGINELCCKLLELNKNDSILDIGSGLASFLIYVKQNYSIKDVTGIDISMDSIIKAKVLAEINKVKINFVNDDVFNFDSTQKYDKVFSLPPFRMDISENLQNFVTNKLGESNKKVTSEIGFMLKTLDSINEKGKAIVCMPASILSTNYKAIAECKKYLIKNNCLEAVIELPAGIFPNTGVKTSLLILSHENKKVRLVNASDMYTKGRIGENSLLSDNVNTVYESFIRDSQFSKSVSYSKIEKNDFNLLPNNYLMSPKILLQKTDYYCKLSELVETNITRGVQIKADELNSLDTTNETGFYYISLKNIQKGIIDNNLIRLQSIDDRYKQYILQESDILLSLTATDSVKVAIAENLSGKKILVASNLYIIRLNNKISPYYLKALFETNNAQKLFKSFTVGTALPTISIEFLKKLEIPVYPLNIQNEIVKKYCLIAKEKEAILSRLEILDVEQKSLFENL